MYKAALSQVERTVTMHTVFCPMCQSKCFDWLVVHMHLNTFCVLCTVKANEQKRITKKLAEFYNQFALLTMI